jgi:hypothetical protein
MKGNMFDFLPWNKRYKEQELKIEFLFQMLISFGRMQSITPGFWAHQISKKEENLSMMRSISSYLQQGEV